MLRTCAAAAKVGGAVCVFLEPIALYQRGISTKTATTAGSPPIRPPKRVPLGPARTYGEATDLTIVTWATGCG